MLLRIDNMEIPIIKASMTRKQSQVDEFEVTVAAKDIDRTQVRFKNASIFRRGQEIISGFVAEKPALELSESGIQTVRLKCYGELGRLLCYRAIPTAHFQDEFAAIIIQTLLASTPDWILTDVSSMVDAAVKTTIDLRNKETLFAQITAVCESIPNLFFRYGGFQAGSHTLHLGFFGERENYLTQEVNLTQLRVNNDSQRIYKILEAYSDRSGDERLTLQAALAYPGIGVHPDWAQFPIQTDDGRYVINNLGITEGCELSKSISINKTKNETPPTAAELAEAGFALWQHGVRFLQENTEDDTYTASGLFEAIPLISSAIRVDANCQEVGYDHTARCERVIETFRIGKWLRVTQIKCDFDVTVMLPGDNCQVEADEYDLELSTSAYQREYSNIVQLHEKLEHHTHADKVSGSNGSGIKDIVLVDVTHLATDPADAACLPDIAKEFTFPMPTPPSGSSNVLGLILNISPPSADAEITQYPALPGTPLIACVQDAGGGWGASNVTIRIAYIFT